MTVRDVYIFEGIGRRAADIDGDDLEEEALADVRYARRLRQAPLITEPWARRAGRVRRSVAVAERDIEDEDEAVDTPAEENRLIRTAFGGLGSLGATLAIIGLLILAAAWTGPSWGWDAGGSVAQGSGAYGFGHGPRLTDGDDPYGPDARYAASAFDAAPRAFVDPPRAMMAGGTLLFIGIVLLATRRRSFLLR